MGLMLTIAVAQYSQYFLYSSCEYLGYRDKLIEVRKGVFFAQRIGVVFGVRLAPRVLGYCKSLKKYLLLRNSKKFHTSFDVY